MKSLQHLSFFGLALAVCISVCLGDAAYTTYKNPLYGFSVDVPKSMKVVTALSARDQCTFADTRGAKLTVFGSKNVSKEDLKGDYQIDLDDHKGAVTYKTLGANWFIVSWSLKGIVTCHKQFVGTGSVTGFLFAYPANQRAIYAPMVEHVGKNFKPGDLTKSH